jgi:hypothetical protein
MESLFIYYESLAANPMLNDFPLSNIHLQFDCFDCVSYNRLLSYAAYRYCHRNSFRKCTLKNKDKKRLSKEKFDTKIFELIKIKTSTRLPRRLILRFSK